MPRPADAEARERYRALLRSALELPPHEREAFVGSRLDGGETLDEALELLEGVEELDGFLEEPFLRGDEVFRPPLPECIGPYRIERVLGWGSTGVVYLAQQSEPRRRVALKVLRVDMSGPSSLDRFRREAQVLATVDHPEVATVYDAGEADLGTGRQPWFAMEYVDGLPVTAYADDAALSRRERIALVARAARAVDFIHRQGIVHRDLKPENLLVRSDGSIRLVDFGIARTRAGDSERLSLTATGQVVGTLAYMAPEQARGGVVDARADQFALGAMLYELLTGALPLPVRGRLPHDALLAVAEGTWTPPSRHDPGLRGDVEAILATALAAEPGRRYASAGALADDLERFLEGRSIQARPPSRFEGIVRAVRRNPFAFGATAAGLLVIGGVLAVALQSATKRRQANDVAVLMSDRALLARLLATEDELWPANLAVLPRIDAWLEAAEEVVGREDRHRRWLDRATIDRSAFGMPVLDDLGRDWLLAEGQAVLDQIGFLVASGGSLERMQRRSRDAAELRPRTVDDHALAWEDAARRVLADPRFQGLVLVPQEGLVPLGCDPESGLEEFAVYSTGSVPVRNPVSKRVVPKEGDALTLVLVPGGERLIGAQTDDPDLPNYALPPIWQAHHGPAVRMHLDPYFISKFEMTQDQWRRAFGRNPSDWEVGSKIQDCGIGPLHPVECMTWGEAVEYLPRHGLCLPTEAQWEVAARGGSVWPWIWGPSLRDANGAVSWAEHVAGPHDAGAVESDGYFPHMPVGRLRPNGYGLHDVLGNVWEFCVDIYKVDYHALDHRESDGRVIAAPDGDVARRGGSCMQPAGHQHVYQRGMRLEGGRDTMTGVRPARALRR